MKFVIVEGSSPFWSGYLVEQWKRLPYRTVLLTARPGLWRESDYDAVVELPLVDGAVDAKALRAKLERHGPIAGALTLFPPAVCRSLEVQRALDVPGLSQLAPRSLRHKWAMVETMAAAGLAVPKTCHGDDVEGLTARAMAELSFPLITKPADLAGDAFVSYVRDEVELKRGIALALAADEQLPDGASVAAAFGCERSVLVQEYVSGRAYSVEGYASQGEISVLAITDKVQSGPPRFEELGHVQPARVRGADWDAILEYAIAMGEAFQLSNGFFHLELRLTSAGPVMVEIGCHLADDLIPRLMELRTGMNTGDLLLRVAAGEPVSAPERWVGAAAVRMVTVPSGGTIARIVAPVLHHDRELAAFDVSPGSVVAAPPGPDRVTRVGYLLASAPDLKGVEARLAELLGETRVELARPGRITVGTPGARQP